MDVTSINLRESTRNSLQEHKKRHNNANYDEAIRDRLEETTDKIPAELSN